MALGKKYIKKVYGKDVTFENAYIQITYDSGNKNSRTMSVSIYDDSNKQNIIEMNTYSFTPNISEGSTNFIQQGYEYLKTLDEFKEATDLLDEGQTA